MSDSRLERAAHLLDASTIQGLPDVAGHEHEILAVRAPITALEPLRALAPELKALGFRYVTLELDAEEERDA